MYLLVKESELCKMKMDHGEYCNDGWQEYWFYDLEVSQCRQFYYGGCAGNANRFKTEHQCISACQKEKKMSVAGNAKFGYGLVSMNCAGFLNSNTCCQYSKGCDTLCLSEE